MPGSSTRSSLSILSWCRGMSESPARAFIGALATGVKSANAGASWLTIDIFCPDATVLDRVYAGLSPAVVAPLYGVEPDQVQIFRYMAALAIKVTVPRHNVLGGGSVSAGDIWETDFDGVQQHVPLLSVEI